MSEAIEITTFKLVGGASVAAFLEANIGMTQWLERQPGFLSRHIAERDDGTIIDLLFWASLAEGQSAADRIIDETADSPVHRMIEMRTVAWQLGEVRSSTQPGGQSKRL